jgi:NADH:ubiquinone reductase (H+-translocating)
MYAPIRIAAEPGQHHIVIVGGGAGGLELATRLGDRLGRSGKATITLVDCARTHIWKPLLHEVAAGVLMPAETEISYLAQARWHHFHFRMGRMQGLDRAQREIYLAATLDEQGREIIPARIIHYDTLVLAVGSVANDFGTPGVQENCFTLDRAEEAVALHERLINMFLEANTQPGPLRPGQLTVAIVGAGATGVELAAELHGTTRELTAYGLDRIDPERDVRIVVIDAMDRILPGLPPRLSQAVAGQLHELGIDTLTQQRVAEVTHQGVRLVSGQLIPSELVIWAAGIKGPDFLAHLDGLEVNRANQLVVEQTLQTTRDANIFAFGDCAACPQPGSDRPVPPRAQAAHQQANLLVQSMQQRIRHLPLPVYVYRDYGSLVSLGRYSTVGNLMGSISRHSLFIEGQIARFVYWLLYKKHQNVLMGMPKVVLLTLGRIFGHPARPRIKLH